MNKFALSLALVAMFVGLVAANKLGHRRHFVDEEVEPEFEEHRPISGHRFRGSGKFGGSGLGEEGSFVGHLPRRGIQHRRRLVKGAGAGVGIGAGSRTEGELDAGIQHGTRVGSHKSAEGSKGFIGGGSKGFGAGVNHHDSNDNEAHHRHSVINKDKLIVKEHDTGFSDDKGFRNRNDHSGSAHIGAQEGSFVGGKAGGRIVDDGEFEHEGGAGIHAGAEHEAGIGAGAGIGGGAALL